MVRPTFKPDAKPGIAEVLFEIDEAYGFHTSMEFIMAAYCSGAVVRCQADAIGRNCPQEATDCEAPNNLSSSLPPSACPIRALQGGKQGSPRA